VTTISRTPIATSRRGRPFRRPPINRRSSPLVLALAMLVLAALIGLVVALPASAHHRPGHGGGAGGGGGGGGASGSWTRTGDPVFGGWGAGAGTKMADGRVLLAGNGLASAEIYDAATGRFKATASLPDSRTNNAIVGLRDGRVLVANGDDYTFGTPTSAWLFDPTTETWSATGSPLATRRIAIGALLNDGRVLVVGGDPDWAPEPAAEVYDPATGTWSATGPMVSPHTPHTATTLVDGRVLVVGDELHRPELYDPASNTWSAAASLQTPRARHAAARLADGRVLVAGGFADRFSPDALASAEIYDPAANTWTRAADLNVARTSGHSATTLADGRVLVAGGGDERLPTGEQFLASAELYNPATNTWTVTRSMTVERAGHLAVLLNNGKVLAVGGADNEAIRTGNSIAGKTAELFTP
jgi:hypothetical protein